MLPKDTTISESAVARFLTMFTVNPETECWEWHRGRNSAEYGVFSLNGGNEIASRAAWRIFRGDIPKGMWILHKCDNPPCCNPDHLYLGTVHENAADAKSRGGYVTAVKKRSLRPDSYAYGERVNTAKLTTAQVHEVRRRHAEGESCCALGREFGIATGNISKIVKFINRAHE